MNKKVLFTVVLFALALLVFNIYTTKVMFTDVAQYLNVGKEFAGISTSQVRNTPGWAYGFVLGKVLSFSPTLLAVKLFNAFWLLLDGILLYFITRKWRSLILWMFSPLVWYMGSWISPLMPVSFLLLFAYHNFKLFEKTNKKRYLAFSGLSLGLISTLWWAGVYVSILFAMSFLAFRKLVLTVFFGIFYSLTFSLRILLDYKLFGLPFYSSLRGLGSNILFGIGKAGAEKALATTVTQLALLVVIISPVLFRFYRVNPFENMKEYLFLFLTSALFIANLQLRYFIVIAPIMLLVLSDFLSKKDIKAHVLLSLILILFLVKPYFGNTEDYLISKDLEKLTSDFPDQKFIVGTDNDPEGYADMLSTLYWGNKVKEFIEYNYEYKLSLKNESVIRSYHFESNPKIRESRKLDFTLNYLRPEAKDYKDVKLLIVVGEQKPPAGFTLNKEYDILKVYQRR